MPSVHLCWLLSKPTIEDNLLGVDRITSKPRGGRFEEEINLAERADSDEEDDQRLQNGKFSA